MLSISGGASADGFSAIKMTALGRPQFLVSLILLYLSTIPLKLEWIIIFVIFLIFMTMQTQKTHCTHHIIQFNHN